MTQWIQGRAPPPAEGEDNYFTELCSGSETGSYLRLIDLFTLHKCRQPAAFATSTCPAKRAHVRDIERQTQGASERERGERQDSLPQYLSFSQSVSHQAPDLRHHRLPRFRAKREHLKRFKRLLPESQGQNLARLSYLCHIRSTAARPFAFTFHTLLRLYGLRPAHGTRASPSWGSSLRFDVQHKHLGCIGVCDQRQGVVKLRGQPTTALPYGFPRKSVR